MAKKVVRAGNYIQTARAKKMPGKTVKVGGTQVLKAKGKKPIAFEKGGLHTQLGVPQGEKIPASKMQAAARGEHGELAQKRARFAQHVLAAGRATAMRKKKGGGRKKK